MNSNQCVNYSSFQVYTASMTLNLSVHNKLLVLELIIDKFVHSSNLGCGLIVKLSVLNSLILYHKYIPSMT